MRNLLISKLFDPIFLFRFLQYSEQYMMDYCLKKPVHTVDGHDISLFEVKQAGLYISWKITSLRKWVFPRTYWVKSMKKTWKNLPAYVLFPPETEINFQS